MNATRSLSRKNALRKSAGIVGDYAATLPTVVGSHLPIVGPAVGLAGFGGTIGGLAVDPGKTKNKDTDILSFTPGVAQYRLMQRLRRVSDASDAEGRSGGANLVAEILGRYTTGAVTGTAGGYAGYKLGPAIAKRLASALGEKAGDPGVARIAGTAAGATLGIAAPALIATIAAAVRRKRTKKEQIDADTTGRAVSKYLVPGLATYDSFKRMGASTHYDEKQKEKKAAEVKTAAGFLDSVIGSGKAPYNPGALSKLLANEHFRRAALGAGVAGATAAVTSKKNRFRNALLAALGGGVATYGTSATGVLDNILSPIRREFNGPLRDYARNTTAREIARTLRGPEYGSPQENVRRFIEAAPTSRFELSTGTR